jgi:hypothetical protein
MKRWVEWVEPFSVYSGGDPVYMRVEDKTAIKAQKGLLAQKGFYDVPDKQALDEFVVVYWATIREEKEEGDK